MENETQIEIPEKHKEFFDSVLSMNGKIGTITYLKKLKPLKRAVNKGFNADIGKISIFQMRAGVDYESQAVVKEKHESGEVERKGLPPSLVKVDVGIYHNVDKDTWMLGVAPVHNENSVSKKVFFVDGKKTSLDEIVFEDLTLQDVLSKSEYTSKPASDWMMLNVDNIVSVTNVK